MEAEINTDAVSEQPGHKRNIAMDNWSEHALPGSLNEGRTPKRRKHTHSESKAKKVLHPQKNWQSGLSLVECNKYMLKNQIECDVKFLVGKEPNPELISAHKFFLASRSSVMFAMFFGQMAETGTIRITDVEANIFRKFLKYLYTDHVKLTGDNVCHLMYTAHKYDVINLMKMCAKYLKKSIQVHNVCTIMENAHFFGVKKLASTCRSFIVENITPIFAADKQNDLCINCLEEIISADNLSTKETVVFKAVMAWTDNHCRRQNLPLSANNEREVMGKLLYKIRFPLMDPKEFSAATDSGILTKEEQIDVFKSLATGGEHATKFSCKPRLPKELICLRNKRNVPTQVLHKAQSDYIIISQNVMAVGLVIILNNDQNEVTVVVKNSVNNFNFMVVHQETQHINMDSVDSDNLLKFYFNKPFVMTSESTYNVQITSCNRYPTIRAQMKQNQTNRSIEKEYGKYSRPLQESVIECFGVEFSFNKGLFNQYAQPSVLKGLIFSK